MKKAYNLATTPELLEKMEVYRKKLNEGGLDGAGTVLRVQLMRLKIDLITEGKALKELDNDLAEQVKKWRGDLNESLGFKRHGASLAEKRNYTVDLSKLEKEIDGKLKEAEKECEQ